MTVLDALEADTVAHAHAAVGKGVRYRLGHGGMHPADPGPTRDGLCDCSGFALWACGLCRLRTDGEWMDTSWIVNDAMGARKAFARLEWEQARPGTLVVYGDRGGRQGHIGVVVATDPAVGPVSVIHCSKGNDSIYGDAIHETGPDAFRTRGIVVCRVLGGTAA